MKGRILVVDDDPIMVMTLKLRLAKAGFKVEVAEDGCEAIEKIDKFQPDAILADITMPRMDGYALRRQLLENPETAGIPFIFLTAKAEISEQLEGLRMGADDYICKPFQMADLIERVESLLEIAEKVKSNRVRADFSGNLKRMTWSDIVQIIELNYKDGELVLSNSDCERIGCAYFQDGELVNAKAGGFEGEEAFYTLMSETDGSFEFFVKKGSWPQLIQPSNAAVLLKGLRMADETSELLRVYADFKVIPRSENYLFPVEIEGKVGKDRLLGFISELEKGRSLRGLVLSGHMSPIRAGALISLLAREKNVKIEEPTPTPASSESEDSFDPLIDEGLVKTLQQMEKRRETGLIQFYNRRRRQALFLRDGRLVHAFHGDVSGKKAAFRIFREMNGTFKFFQQPVAVHNTIDSSLSKLLEEGKQEIRQLKELENNFFEKTVVVDTEKNQKTVEDKIIPHKREFLALAERHGRISDIVDASELADGEAVEQLRNLIEIGLLRGGDGSDLFVRKEGQLATDPAY